MHSIDIFASVFAIAGKYCLAERYAAGWWLFMLANVLLSVIAYRLERWGLIPGYLLLSAMDVYGLRKWRSS